MKLVIAPDSFKGSLTAAEVASCIAAGWSAVRPNDDVTRIPQADGGEGTLDAIEAAVAGSIRHEVGPVTGPDGRPTPGAWLELPGRVAVVELAQMSGLPLMRTPDPLGATTFGLGEVIRTAIGHGAQKLVIGLGGSASTDGGAGALSALGLRQADGAALPLGGAALAALTALDARELIAAPPGGVVLLTDTAAPLLGQRGAAAVFGPQKGATPGQVGQLDGALRHFAGLLEPRAANSNEGGGIEEAGGSQKAADTPGAGAAGGTGFGFIAAWGATVEPGAEYLANLSGLPTAIAAAEVLLTGEGRFDATSLTGKLVGELIRIAGEHRVTVGVIAGQLAAKPVGTDGAPLWSAAIAELAGSVEAALADPARWLSAAGAAAARSIAPTFSRPGSS